MSDTLERLRGGLIVSCQTKPPLAAPEVLAAMAEAAVVAGALGIRADGGATLAAIRRRVAVPIVGIKKERHEGSLVYITPTIAAVREVLDAGTEIVALDGTMAPRPNGVALRELIAAIHAASALAMADVSTATEGIAAAAAGADLLASTLSGYTPQSRQLPGPDLELLDELRRIGLPVIAEGRYYTPADVKAAFDQGVLAVVVGRAITEPQFLTRNFVAATPRARSA